MYYTFNRFVMDPDIVNEADHGFTSDDLAYEERQDELDELKAQLAEWEA